MHTCMLAYIHTYIQYTYIHGPCDWSIGPCCAASGRGLGYPAASFELDDSPLQNFLSGIGFAYALALVARVCRYVPGTENVVEIPN